MLIYNYYFAILILAIIFFFISNKSPSILIAIIIIIILGYNYFDKIYTHNEKLKSNYKNKITILENDSDKIAYLDNDKYLVELLLNIRFIKIFDSDKYAKLITQTEKLMKIYIFMLGDRYDINERFTSFLNIRNEIINNLYSCYLIIPFKLKFIFNLNPQEELKKTINEFIKYTRKMIIIIEKYAYEKKGIKYLQDTKYKPFNYNYTDLSFEVF